MTASTFRTDERTMGLSVAAGAGGTLVRTRDSDSSSEGGGLDSTNSGFCSGVGSAIGSGHTGFAWA